MSKASLLRGLKNGYLKVCQRIGATIHAPSQKQVQVSLFVVGVTLLVAGITSGVTAQDLDSHDIHYNDTQIVAALTAILSYVEGTFGALIMVAAGLGAILSSAFGQYKAALGCLIIAVGSFFLRSVMSTFFNVENVPGLDGAGS